MGKNSTDFNINVNLKNKGVVKGANQSNVALAGMGSAGMMAGRSINAGMLKAGLAITGVVVAVATLKKVLTHAITVGKEFEQSMADVKAILGTSQSEFRQLSQEAQRLGASTKFTASEVSGLIKELGKLGFNTKEILDSTESILNLAAAVGTDISRASEVAGSTLRAFKLDADQAGRVADVMAKSFTTSALDMEKFAESMKYIAPIASTAGYSIEQATALIGELANVGIHGSMAGTSLSRALLLLNKSGSKLNKIFGKTVGSFDELVEVLIETKENGGLTQKQMDLMPTRLAKIIPPLVEASDKLQDYSTSLENSGGSAEAMAEIQMDTLQGSLLELNSAWEGLGIVIYEDILPSFKPLIDGITSVVSALSDWLAVPLSDKLQEDRGHMNALASSALELAEGSQARANAITALKNAYPEYFSDLDEESAKNKDIAKQVRMTNQAMITKIVIQKRKEDIADLLEDAIAFETEAEKYKGDLAVALLPLEEEIKNWGPRMTLAVDMASKNTSLAPLAKRFENMDFITMFDPQEQFKKSARHLEDGVGWYELTVVEQFEFLDGLISQNYKDLTNALGGGNLGEERFQDMFGSNLRHKVYETVGIDELGGETFTTYESTDLGRALDESAAKHNRVKMNMRLSNAEYDKQNPKVDRLNRVIARLTETLNGQLGVFEEANEHTVVSGDTLSQIAKKYNTTTKEVLRLNEGLKENSTLQIGQKIRVPKPTESGGSTTKKTASFDSGLVPTAQVGDVSGYQAFLNQIQTLDEGALSVKLAHYETQKEAHLAFLKAQFEASGKSSEDFKNLKLAEAEVIEQTERMKRLATIQTLQQGLADMSSNAKKMAKQGMISGKAAKAVAISEAIVSTYLAANKAYAAMAGIPIVGPALGAVAAAFAIGGGLANVKQIQKAKFAKGGAVTSPTLAMIGEAGEEEFVAPKQQFSEWANQTLGIENNFNDTNIVNKLNNIELAINNQPSASDIANAIGRTNRGRLN